MKPSEYMTRIYPRRLWQDLYGPRTLYLDAYPQEMRYKPNETQENVEMRQIRLQRLLHPPNLQAATSDIMDEDELVAGADRRWRCFSSYVEDDVVFHYNPDRDCDVSRVDRTLIGDPSARIIRSANDALGIYCFNCLTVTWAISIWDPAFLANNVEQEDVILDPMIEKINWQGRVDIDLVAATQKFLVIDAPPGTGKTELIGSYMAHPSMASKCIIVLTFRVSLAAYLADRLKCRLYTEDKILHPGNMSARKRLAICLDSILHIPNDQFDIVVLDEASLIRMHTVSDTIAPRREDVLKVLTRYIRDAETVIIAQYQLVCCFWSIDIT